MRHERIRAQPVALSGASPSGAGSNPAPRNQFWSVVRVTRSGGTPRSRTPPAPHVRSPATRPDPTRGSTCHPRVPRESR